MVNFRMSSCIDQSGEGDEQGFAPVCCSRSAFSGAKRFYSAHENLSSSLVCHNNSRTAPQEAQKFRPARPQRVKTRGVPLGYVEVLNDARTPLANFFSLLLFRHENQHPWGAFFNHVRKPSGGTAGGNTWKGPSPTNLNGAETIGEMLSRV
jgi:hypothetical protein